MPRVTEEINLSLFRSVSKEEIKETLFSINPSKAPGAYGMICMFYQHYWEVLGDLVTLEIQEFFIKASFPWIRIIHNSALYQRKWVLVGCQI